MRARPIVWITLGVIFLVGVFAYLRLAHRPAAPTETVQSSKTALPSRLHRVAATNSYSVAESTSPGFIAGQAKSKAAPKPDLLALRLRNTTKNVNQLLGDDRAVLLENALIDTSQPIDFSIPNHLRAPADPGSYIVQCRGPVDNAFRAALAAAGATIVSYIPNNAYLVRASTAAATQLKANPQTQSVLPYEPVYKLKTELLGLGLADEPLPPGTTLNVMAFADGRAELMAELQQRGLTVLSESPSPFGPVIRVQLAEGQEWVSLAKLPAVELLELVARRAAANDLSRARVAVAVNTQTNANHLNLTGSNVLVALNDSGVSINHPDLLNRVFPQVLALGQDNNGHGTHVAGIIAGDGAQSLTVTNAKGSINPGTNSQYRGMAPGARLYVQSWADSDVSLQEGAALTNALISNNSWNDAASTYGITASSYDAAVRDSLAGVTGSQPVLYVFSAGNAGDGGDLGLGGDQGSILSPGTAKNVLTVGAIELSRDITNEVITITNTGVALITNTTTPWKGMTSSGNQVAAFSSRGNVGVGIEGDYGRFKPDLVAPGTFVISTRSMTWDERAYYNPTSHHIDTFSGQVVPPTIAANGFDYYGEVPLLGNSVGFTLNVVNRTNLETQAPVPFLPIFVKRDDYPVPSPGGYNFVRSNFVAVPPDAPGVDPTANPSWFFAVGNTLTQSVRFDLIRDVITTNDSGNQLEVLSNLNNSISGIAPNYYRYESGTSMSAADVSGTLALMQQFFRDRGMTISPALMKALLINGARRVGDLYDFQVQSTLNYQGWGLVKLANSVPGPLTNGFNTISNSMFFFDQSPANALATGQGHTRFISVRPGGRTLPLRVSLVWTDPPGNPAAGVKLVNNLDLVVTNLDNPATPIVYHGNEFPANSEFSFRWDPFVSPDFDSVNNVENVYIDADLGTNYSITVIARRVNVNAVTAQANNVVQDYALVISSGNGEAADALTLGSSQPQFQAPNRIAVAVVSNFFNGGTFSTASLINQRIGASTPLLGTTNGMTNQWQFYIVTNSTQFTNAAFLVSGATDLALPRTGVFQTENPSQATRRFADVDLYVSLDPNLLVLDPTAVANATKSRTRNALNGDEAVIFSNSVPNRVYYVGVKSEDQMAAQYELAVVFSLDPLGSEDEDGFIPAYPLLPPQGYIPDGSPAFPGASKWLTFLTGSGEIRRVIVTNRISHEKYSDLVSSVVSPSSKVVILNNHRTVFSPVAPGPYGYVYEDNDEGYLGAIHPDGPGKLRDFVGDTASGQWNFFFVDNALTQTGRVESCRIRVERQPGNGESVTNTVLPFSWQYYAVNVPVGATNLTVCLALISSDPAPLRVFVRKDQFPTATAYDFTWTVNPPTGAPPGSCTSITLSDLPPLSPGRYYIGIFNPNNRNQTYVYTATYYLGPGVTPINWSGTGNLPVLDDAVGDYTQFVTNNARIAQLEVGLRIDHPRVSDLAVTLISPRGTRVLLVENRGGTSPDGFGSTLYVTNFVPVSASGSNQPQSTVVDTGATVGELTIDYNFFDVPDQMTVYYQGALLWDSTMITGAGQKTLAYGLGASTEVTIIVNQFPNTNTTTQWSYTVSSTSSTHSYLTFTENTNLTTTPIKFALPPFLPPNAPTPISISDFEFSAPTTNVAGNYFGPISGAPDGWNVMSTDPVTVVSNPPPANTGQQSLVLRSGQILRNVPTTPQRSYRLNYAHRQVPNLDGIVSWWPGDQLFVDVVGTNNGTPVSAVTFSAGEVGSGFLLNGVDSRIMVADSDSLDLSNALTIEAWVNPRVITGMSREIFSKVGGPVDQRSYTLSINTSGRAYFAVSSDGSAFSGTIATGTSIVPLNQWTHIAATYDGATIRLFVNGILESSVAWTLGIFQGTAPVVIGATLTTGTSATSFFNGTIDELTAYRRTLTPNEVQSIYAAGASGKFGLMFPPNAQLVSTNYPFRRLPVGGQIYVPGQVTNSFLGDANWQPGGLIFRAVSNSTPVGLSPVVTGNHYYQFVRTNISWQNARATAAALSTNGLTAHLATITSAAENEFIRLNFATNLLNEFAWIGGREPASNGVWRWDVGPEANLPISTGPTPVPPFNYVNWGAGEPNNSKPNEDFVMFNIGTTFGTIANGQWADAAPTNSPSDPVVGYLVEYEPIPPIQSGVMVDSFVLQEASQPLYVLGEESLDILRGENAYGEWRLEIWDSRVGALNNVSLVDWQMQFVFITNTSAARQLQPCAPTTTTIPPGQIFYYTVDVPTPARFGTNFLGIASGGPLGLYFNQTVPPGSGGTNVGAGDIYFGAANLGVNLITNMSTTGIPPLLPGQRYYLAVENSGASNVTYTLQVCFDLSSIPPSTVIMSGQASCATNVTPLGIDYYLFTVSANAKRAQFEIENPSGDMTLLVRRGLPPTYAVFDYFSANPFTNDELVTIFDSSVPVPLTPGAWYLGAANLSSGPVTYCIRATEWFEYGTNIVITNWALTTNSFCITWTSLPGVNYFVEGVTDLSSTNWVTASPTITATGYSTTYCIPLPSPLHFFRVRDGLALSTYLPPPVITRIDKVLTGFLISWSGPTNAEYNVQWTPTFNAPPPVVWTTFTNPPTVTSINGLFQFLDTGAETGGLGPMRFYRLLLLP